MRCNDCNRFVGLDAEVQETSIDLADDGTLTGTVTVVRNCAECGTTLLEATVELEGDESDALAAHRHTHDDEEEVAFDLDHDDAEVTEEGKGRKFRYVITASATICCSVDKCDFEHKAELTNSVGKEEFDEC